MSPQKMVNYLSMVLHISPKHGKFRPVPDVKAHVGNRALAQLILNL